MTPQNEAGRITDPPVWVPSAAGTCKSATAAAEPLEEPPGGAPVRGAVEGGAGERLGGQCRGAELRDSLGGGKPVWRGHCRAPKWRSTQRPTASRRRSPWRRPTSWIPTGNPSGPSPKGKVRQ